MTVTRAAMSTQILQHMKPDIIIVEEAAEVLEANMLGSLFIGNNPETHIVMIGDHKQLRPAVACEDLELENRLDLSLFERLVNNNIPCATLTHQRRMHEALTPLHSWIYKVLYSILIHN